MSDKHVTPPVIFMLEEKIAELEKKLAERDKEIHDYQTGWLGCCHTCEPVAIKNQWQNEMLHRLVEKLGFVLDRFDVLTGGEAGMNHIKDFYSKVKKSLQEKEGE